VQKHDRPGMRGGVFFLNDQRVDHFTWNSIRLFLARPSAVLF